jgi:hypothetical protein
MKKNRSARAAAQVIPIATPVNDPLSAFTA